MSTSPGNPIEHIRSVMLNLISALVDHPASLQINVMLGEQTTVYEVRCHMNDRGKVIGKAGTMAQSLRHILTSLAARNKVRAILEIVD